MRMITVALAIALVTEWQPAEADVSTDTRTLTCDTPAACKKQCTSGDAGACTSLATMHHHGIFARTDVAQAARLYEQACKLDDAWACLAYSQLSLHGWMFDVERSPERFEEYFDRATRVADAGCVRGDGPACLTLAEINHRVLEREQWAKSAVDKRLSPMLRAARTGCKAGNTDSCRWLHARAESLENRGLLPAKRRKNLQEVAVKQYPRSCRKGDSEACYQASKYEDDAPTKYKLLKPACDANHRLACMHLTVVSFELLEEKASQMTSEDEIRELIKPLLTIAFRSCEGRGHEECAEFLDMLFFGDDDIGLAKDIDRGLTMLENLCKAGDLQACLHIGQMLLDGDKDRNVAKNAKRAQDNLARACLLTPSSESCALCQLAPESDQCLMRRCWAQHTSCIEGDDGACESVAEQFRDGKGVTKDARRAARYYRRACDAAVKTSCGALDDLCLAHPDLGDDLCHQSLIHSDLFYEAEWQFRQNGSASILTGDASEPAAEIQARVSGAVSASASARLELSRGSLDADLVVSIVLDRARQAAIRLVVDELKRAGKGDDVPRYLYDLLTQASLLLADQSTLRREKFQDLAMTVVRAFVASNLIKTVFPDDGSIVGAKQIATLTRGKLDLSTLDDQDARRLRRYFTDWTYFLLGETKLFGRAAGEQVKAPVCPFETGPGRELCNVFSRPDGSPDINRLMALLHVDMVLQGIALAKMVRAEGAIDLRRFVEAIGKSRSIANLLSTPGLDLDQWESEVIIGFRTQMARLQERLEAVRQLVSVARSLEPQAENTMDVVTQLASHADVALELLDGHVYKTLLGRESHKRALELATLIKTSVDKLQRGPLGGGGGNPAQIAALAADIQAVFRRWDKSGVTEFIDSAERLLQNLKSAKQSIAELTQTVSDIRSLMGRLAKGKGSFDVSDLPLHEIPELKELFQRAAVALTRIDRDVQSLFPNASRTKVRFAVSAVVRLLGFLDLMERIARKARLNQRCGDIIRAMKILGSVKNSSFSAPLFDIMDPVLHAIETHEPMNTDLLFAMIARVRLDSLITSLASEARKPCRGGSRSTECWTVKVIHALQESIQRDGNLIRIDGGKFAERLASHGDDFRRRNKWRSYFHLTVGFGGLYSLSPPLDSGDTFMDGADRTVPMVSEQIGFGWASPVFWRDRLTFKAGVFASGILYRAVLDSAESNAIMVSPFIALDVYDLVEVYAAPTMMFYPPIDDRDVGVRFGAMVGLSVPLGDYLQRL